MQLLCSYVCLASSVSDESASSPSSPLSSVVTPSSAGWSDSSSPPSPSPPQAPSTSTRAKLISSQNFFIIKAPLILNSIHLSHTPKSITVKQPQSICHKIKDASKETPFIIYYIFSLR